MAKEFTTISHMHIGSVFKGKGTQYLQLIAKLKVTPGSGQEDLYKVTVRDLTTDKESVHHYKPSQKMEMITPTAVKAEFLYCDGDQFVFVDEELTDIVISQDKVGAKAKFLKETDWAVLHFCDNELIMMTLPSIVELQVSDREEVKDSTQGSVMATLETGVKMLIPSHILVGDTVKIDTTTSSLI